MSANFDVLLGALDRSLKKTYTKTKRKEKNSAEEKRNGNLLLIYDNEKYLKKKNAENRNSEEKKEVPRSFRLLADIS